MIPQFLTRQLQEIVEFLKLVFHIHLHRDVALGLKLGKVKI